MSLTASPFLLLRTPQQSLAKACTVDPVLTPIFEEGLYLSSPAYWQEFCKRDQFTGKDKEKVERSFNKYWIRSCMRSTPYGTFAGSKLISVVEGNTNITLTASSCHKRCMRVDMNYITELITALTQVEQIREQLKFYPNNSIYELPGSFRYAEYTISNNVRSYQLTSVDNTGYLKAILQRAASGADMKSLVVLLMNKEQASEEEAMNFITDMWQSQLLVSQLEPCVTGKEPLDELIEKLEPLTGTEELLSRLKNIQQLITNPVEGVKHYQLIEEELKNLGVAVEIPKNTLQTDLFLTTENSEINKDLITAILNQAKDLLFLGREAKNSELEDFRSRFYARYEDTEIPLAVALDADLGIGYAGVKDETAGGSDWVDDLAAVRESSPATRGDFTYAEQFALTKYNDYIKQNKHCIEITEEELKSFKKNTEKYRFPNSLYLMGSLLKKDTLLTPENFTFDVSGMGGPSAANLLGRFTHGDAQLYRLTREILKTEEKEYPDCIYAEIAHLPQARIGNILLRPVLRDYEIPYVGRSGAPEANQIAVDDLMVSVQNNKVILRSKKHNKRVIPRLTTAHNFSHQSLPVYKFLCDIQAQGIAYPNVWSWGTLSSLNHLPRVSYKDLILQKAKWTINDKDIADLPKKVMEYPAYFKIFCQKCSLPQRVVYAEADNELLIDFAQDRGIDLFLHYLKKYKKIQLEEFLFTEENCFVKDIDGNPFTNEVIIPLYRETPEKRQVQLGAGKTLVVQRKFAPNSEWQYFKVYCGSKTAENILSNAILPFIENGIKGNLFERFFFIRYRDEFGHFRIRFYNSDKAKQAALQAQFMDVLQPLLDEGAISKVMLDTYSRELERYGDDLMEATESLFYNDSLAVLRFINMLEGTDTDRYRMLFALRGVDILLNDFDFSLSEKHVLLKSMQHSFYQEFGASPILQKQLNEKYRKHQQDIFKHLNPVNDIANEIDEAVAIFDIRSEMNGVIIAAIKNTLLQKNELSKLNDLLPSYIHMFMNRIFIAQQRKYELVVYHFLEKYYSSQLAIAQKEAKAVAKTQIPNII